jgi:peptidoglycan biosynthesis protein MviN/MurJ (putative lipid II flippase)
MGGENIKKRTFLIYGIRFFRMLVTLLTLSLVAKYFGVSIERDAWVIILTFFSVLGLAIWGPLNEIFRTNYYILKEQQGEVFAYARSNSLFVLVVLVSCFVGSILFIFSHQLAYFLDATASKDKVDLLATLIQFMIPTLLVNQLIALGISILNANDEYYITELMSVVASLISLILILVLTPILGIYSLVASQYVSILLVLSTVFYLLSSKGIRPLLLGRLKWQDIRFFLWVAAPFYLPFIGGQLNQLTESWMASSLGSGSLSTLDYARQLFLALIAVLSGVLTTVMVPGLVKSYAQNDSSSFTKVFKESLSVSFFVLSFMVPLLVGAAPVLGNLLYTNNKISAADTLLIIDLIRYYGVAFVGITVYLFFGLGLLASQKEKKYALIGLLAQAFVFLINVLLVDDWGLYIFPVSIGVGHLGVGLIMSYYLSVDNKLMIFQKMVKYVLVIACITLVIFIFNRMAGSFTLLNQLILNGVLLIVLSTLLSRFLDFNIINFTKYAFQKGA